MNYTFIGMSGAGKSFVGGHFAVARGLRFIDIDRAMEERYGGKPLQEILDEIGEEKFLAEQATQVLSLTGIENTVISPGGSVVYSDEAMQFLRGNSHIVYLEVPLGEILKRIKDQPRGIVGLGEKTIKELYLERSLLYKKWAHQIVSAENKTPKEIIAEIAL